MKYKLIITLFLMNSIWSYCQENDIEPYKVLQGHKYKVQAAFFSPDGKFIISHGWDNTVKLWDARTFSEIRTFEGHTDQVWCAAISPDNKLIASGSMDRSFIIWDVETGEKKQQVQLSPYNAPTKGLIPELDGEIANSVYSVSFSPNGENLAIASADKLVRIWDLENARFIDSLDGQHHTNWMWCRYSPDGKYLIGGSNASKFEEGVKVIWETETYKQTGRIVMSGKILFTEDKELGIYAGNSSMNFYNLSNCSYITSKPFPDFKGSLDLSPDRKYMVSCNEDSYIILRNVKTQEVVWTYENEKREIHRAHFSPDGKYLIAGRPEADILIWKMESLLEEHAQDTIPEIVLEGHQYTVYSIDISEDSKYLVSGGWDNTVKLWDYKNAKEIKSFDYHKDMIRDLCFSKDNSMIASASRDNTIKINKLSTGETITITNDYKPNIEEYYRNTYFSSISFMPDNKQLVFTLAGRNEIFFWDINTNTLSEKIVGPGCGIKKVEVSISGKYIAAITRDNSIIIWDLDTKKQISVLKGHAGSVGNLCFSRNEKFLVSSGGSNVSYRKPMEYYNLMVWDVVKGDLASVLTGHVDVVMMAKFSPDGRYIASASEDNSVRVWDVSTSKQIWKYESDCYFLSCCISPDGKYLAASSRDETIKIWDLKKIISF